MNILFDLGHAAHFHLFKNLIVELEKNGHQITVTSRDKPYLLELLNNARIKHICLSKPGGNILSLFTEWIKRTYKIVKLNRQHKFHLAVGTSVSISYLSLFSKTISINVQEDDDNVVPLHVMLAYPFSDYILNPHFLRFRFFKSKRILHNSLHEMAYLSNSRFLPSFKVVEKYNLKPFEYILLRKVSFKAHHDINQSGLSVLHVNELEKLARDIKIVTSEEGELTRVDVSDMHHILAFAKLVVTDSQTMAAESACLGTPVIQVSTFKNEISYIRELCLQGFIHYFHPKEFEDYKVCLSAELERITNESDRKISINKINSIYPDFTEIMKREIEKIAIENA